MENMPAEGRRVSLAFDQIVRTDLRLLEVDEAVLAEIVQQGAVIKGGPDAEAFLVTNDKSFSIKYVETSNLQLLLPPASLNDENSFNDMDADVSASQELLSPAGLQTQVHRMRVARAHAGLLVGATTKAHLELCEARPRLHLLHEMLSKRPYRGEEEEEEEQADTSARERDQGRTDHMDVDGQEDRGAVRVGRGLYSLEQMLAEVQASEHEIRGELASLHALELDGCWRAVDPGYLGQMVELLILSAQSEGMPLTALDPESLCCVMAADGYRPELVRHCLAVYGSLTEGKATWQLDETKVCRYLAHKVLNAQAQGPHGNAADGACGMPGPGMPMQRFMSAWHAAAPSGVQPQMSMLQGEVLTEGKGADALVHSFPVSALPADPAARFTLLFSLRQQWESTDMEPFLVGLQAPGQTAGALLLKYTRASQPSPDGPKFFTAR